MSFLIPDALAADATAAPAGGAVANLVFFGLIFVVFYFLLIRPQTKRAKEHKAMVDALAKGDEVITNGGIAGKITEVSDNFLTVEIADKISVKVQRQAIQAVLPKGTLKS